MRALITIVCFALLAGCASRAVYDTQLAFLQTQQRDRIAAEDARAERLAQRHADCAALTDPPAITACMLGATALTLAAERGAGNAQQGIIMPPAPPRSGWAVAGDFVLGMTKIAAPVVLGIRQSDNSTELGIAQGEQLYGFLGRTAEAQSTFGVAALGSMERLGTSAVDQIGTVAGSSVDAMAQTSNAWATAAPLLAPDITVEGTGNVVGDGNSLALDQSQQGRDRIAEGTGNTLAIDQSTVAGDRLHQEGTDNRQTSPGPYDQAITCELVSNGAAGGDGAPGSGTGGTGGAGSPGGAGTGILTCTPGNGG